MKKLLLAALFISSMAHTQNVPPLQWQKNYGGSSSDWIGSFAQTPDGGFILQGITVSANGDATGNHGNYDLLVVKTDPDGNTLWKKLYGSTGFENTGNILNTSDGGYLMGGTCGANNGDVSGNHGSTDYWIVKLDNAGNIQWQKSYGGSNSENLYNIKETSDGGYIAIGNSTSIDGDISGNYGNLDTWVIKISSSGILQWQKNYGGTGIDLGSDIVEMPGGDFIFCGGTYSSNGNVSINYGDKDAWLMRISGTNGTAIWSQTYGGSSFDELNSLQLTNDFSISIAASGSTNSNDYNITGNHGSTDILFVTLDGASGILNSARCYGGSNGEYAYNISNTFDQGYFITGYTTSNDGEVSGNHGNSDIWALKLSRGGDIDWQKCLGGTAAERGFRGMETSEGGYFVAGGANSINGDATNNYGGEDLWAVKLSNCFIPPASTATVSANTYACGSTVTMGVPGGIPYTYQWKKNGVNITGATAKIFTASQKGNYTCIVSNGACGVINSPNTIASAAQTATITPSGTVTKCAADPVNFLANTGTDLAYQWYRNNNIIAGQTNSTYSTKKAGKYKVLVSNSSTGCTKFSKTTTVVINCFVPSINTPANAAILPGNIDLANRPNPFNISTSISFQIPFAYKNGSINITDFSGRLIKQLILSGAQTGIITLSSEGLAAGTYLYLLVADNKVLKTEKMVIIQ